MLLWKGVSPSLAPAPSSCRSIVQSKASHMPLDILPGQQNWTPGESSSNVTVVQESFSAGFRGQGFAQSNSEWISDLMLGNGEWFAGGCFNSSPWHKGWLQQEFSLYPWRLRSRRSQWSLQWLGRTIPSKDHGLPTFRPLPSASGETLASLPRQGDDGQSIVLAPIHHEGLVQATKTTAEIVGVMKAESEIALEEVAVYQKAPLSASPKKHLRVHCPNYLVVTNHCGHMGQSESHKSGCWTLQRAWESRLFVIHSSHFLRCCSSRKVEVWLGWWYEGDLVLELRSPGDTGLCERLGLLLIAWVYSLRKYVKKHEH